MPYPNEPQSDFWLVVAAAIITGLIVASFISAFIR